VNTEEELHGIVGKQCVGVGAIPDKGCIMVFFLGSTLAVRFEHGVLTWEVIQDVVH
jgi:hypothetical protein